MANTTNRQASVDSRRVALEREVSIRVPRFDTFVTEYSQNISTTGMFIVSDDPQPPGTTFSFEFSVADDWKLIRGKAQVVWTRYRDEGPERPPGMGVRFLEVDAQSRRLVRWIVEKHIREGGKPFELDELRSVIDQALEEVLDPDEPAPKTTQKSVPGVTAPPQAKPAPSVRAAAATTISDRKERRALPLLLTAVAILITVGILFWLTEVIPGKNLSESSNASTQADRLSGTATNVSSGTSAPAASDSVLREEVADTESSSRAAAGLSSGARPMAEEQGTLPRDQPPPPLGSAYKSVLDSVTAWADAWSDQDLASYLGSYAQTFTPDAGLSRRQWEAQRRERLARPDFIKVSISGLELERLDDTTVRVTFSQSYRSDRFSDLVRKRMELVWEAGRWKISSESAS